MEGSALSLPKYQGIDGAMPSNMAGFHAKWYR
jgi:hypothetical protein